MTIKPLPSALPLAGWVNQTILSRYNPCTRECTSSYSKEKMTWQQGRRALMTLCHCQPELSPIPSLWLALIALKLLAQKAKNYKLNRDKYCMMSQHRQAFGSSLFASKSLWNKYKYKGHGNTALPAEYYFKPLACLDTPPTILVGYLQGHSTALANSQQI